ncbi:MAG: HAD hydrolase family protein [Candidatus Melainabacteria bacterium]|jgi:hydroxymethylpyrimidine pyrophosphatase-like HAD family hydrolase|nr:HAD hydrolase family protein [Candidatus Melainabacteria bacterium]
MRYLALATDYDGTIAADGQVSESTVEALKLAKQSGRKIILVTGREMPSLMNCFPQWEIFDAIVAENGALLYVPSTKHEEVLCEPPNQHLVDMLRAKNVEPLSVGKGILATWVPHDGLVLECIKTLGLESQIIFNKGAVMILPPGVNKASGLAAALKHLGLSPHNVVGVGDAENDHAFLTASEFSVAVDNALPALKERADFVTKSKRGAGVEESIKQLIEDDFLQLSPKRHFVSAGAREDGEKEMIDPYNTGILICGSSGAGKSTTTLGILDQLCRSNYQICLIDPEGDYESFHNAVVIGDTERAPTIEEVLQLLADPSKSVIVNLLGIKLEDRPQFFTELLPRLQELRTSHGRPHWTVVDEAHHMFPVEWKKMSQLAPENLRSILMITVHPEKLAPEVYASVDLLITIGDKAADKIKDFAEHAGLEAPKLHKQKDLEQGYGFGWLTRKSKQVELLKLELSEIEKVRHKRKYAEGQLPEERSFYFRGPDGKLNLRVQNLALFNQIARGVDDDTWTFHLHNHDYSKWFKEFIKDDELSTEAMMIESKKNISAEETRELICAAIEKRYTLPATG